ncbi:hypothetical protein RA266_27900, partial [Pseudomonas syringae pv. tagetis]|uniref:hypothetical protein n=1 Tax=Pseudomonas syringae group genomosp. 7 TaxID=251699 RepID=UPI00377010FE
MGWGWGCWGGVGLWWGWCGVCGVFGLWLVVFCWGLVFRFVVVCVCGCWVFWWVGGVGRAAARLGARVCFVF